MIPKYCSSACGGRHHSGVKTPKVFYDKIKSNQ